MAWIKKRFGLGKPSNVEQSLLASAQESSDEIRERLSRLERLEQIRARQDIKRRAFD